MVIILRFSRQCRARRAVRSFINIMTFSDWTPIGVHSHSIDGLARRSMDGAVCLRLCFSMTLVGDVQRGPECACSTKLWAKKSSRNGPKVPHEVVPGIEKHPREAVSPLVKAIFGWRFTWLQAVVNHAIRSVVVLWERTTLINALDTINLSAAELFPLSSSKCFRCFEDKPITEIKTGSSVSVESSFCDWIFWLMLLIDVCRKPDNHKWHVNAFDAAYQREFSWQRDKHVDECKS